MNKQEISDGHFSVGGTSLTLLEECVQQQIPESYRCEYAVTFYRLEIRGQLYYSKSYFRVKSRNSYTISFVDSQSSQQRFGQVLRYVQIPTYGVYAILKFLRQVSCLRSATVS